MAAGFDKEFLHFRKLELLARLTSASKPEDESEPDNSSDISRDLKRVNLTQAVRLDGEHQIIIEPVFKLKNCQKFTIDSSTSGAPESSILKLKMIKQYPGQQDMEKPLFELAAMADQHDDMEKNMTAFYNKVDEKQYLNPELIRKGIYAVLCIEKDDQDDDDMSFYSNGINFDYKRIKIKKIVKDTDVYRIVYIDYSTEEDLESKDLIDILPLDKQFAVLCPRVTDIEMEGLSFYKDTYLQKFIDYESEEYAFQGILTAEVEKSGKVIIWSDRFPKDKFPYGINGYIIETIWETIEGTPELPGKGHARTGAYILNASEKGVISIQFNSKIAEHHSQVIAGVTEEEISLLRGSVKKIEKGEVYMAPYAGTYYRASFDESFEGSLKNPEDEAPIIFIDYGDKDIVKLGDLVKAKDINYLLGKFPKQYVQAKLENIKSLDKDRYINRFHITDDQYEVLVVEDGKKNQELPKVLLRYQDGRLQTVNERIMKEGIGQAVNPQVKYSEYEDNGMEVKIRRVVKEMPTN